MDLIISMSCRVWLAGQVEELVINHRVDVEVFLKQGVKTPNFSQNVLMGRKICMTDELKSNCARRSQLWNMESINGIPGLCGKWQIWCWCKHTGCDICCCKHNLLWCRDTALLGVIAVLLSANGILTFAPSQLYSSCTDSASLQPSGLGKWTITAGMYRLSECNNKGWKRSHQLEWQHWLICRGYINCTHTYSVRLFTHACSLSRVSTPEWQVTLWPCVVWLNHLGHQEPIGHCHLFQNTLDCNCQWQQ